MAAKPKHPPISQGCISGRTQTRHAVHYPLNGVDLDFRRYAHHPLGQRDIMMSRIMEDYMRPRLVKGKAYFQEVPEESPFGHVKAQNRQFGLDLQVASKMLLTRPNVIGSSELDELDWEIIMQSLAPPPPWYHCRSRLSYALDDRPTLDEIVYHLLQCHFLEAHTALQMFLKLKKHSDGDRRDPSVGWKKDMIEHLKIFKPNLAMQQRLQLYSGGQQHLVHSQTDPKFLIDPCLIALRSGDFFYHLQALLPRIIKILQAGRIARPFHTITFHDFHNVKRRVPRRRHSLPPSGTWCSVNWGNKYIIFPRRRLSEMDKLSRRRSLSRSHIRAMFRDRSPVARKGDSVDPRSMNVFRNRCKNCNKYTHRTDGCQSNCGYCNSDKHKADSCPVQPVNRCKCRPFPQFHTAADCFVRCSRRCGSPYPPGHFKHKNAMLCSHRCCMCGLKGHAGRKCNLLKCRCGENHLTQDCRWKVECPAKSCERYLCTNHCRECGRGRDKEAKEYFVGMTCPECLQNGNPVAPNVDQTSRSHGTGSR